MFIFLEINVMSLSKEHSLLVENTHTHMCTHNKGRIIPLPSSQSHGVDPAFGPRVVREPAS